jgi:DNA-binding CsgD family transcriptional regulator
MDRENSDGHLSPKDLRIFVLLARQKSVNEIVEILNVTASRVIKLHRKSGFVKEK